MEIAEIFWTRKRVLAELSRSRSWLYRQEKAGRFVTAHKISERAVLYRREEVIAWVKSHAK